MAFYFLGSRSYRQHYALIPFCSALPLNKGRTPVYLLFPGSLIAYTWQKVIFIAIVSNYIVDPVDINFKSLTTCIVSWTSSNKQIIQEVAAENNIAWSLHLLHVPQAVMLECRLEILTNYSSSEKPAHLNMQPHKWGSVQWCTGKWHLYGGCFVEYLTTWYLASGV